ncbi:Uncharacterised protein [Mycobacteroides abscessus subsp. abscessus]|nr:Uncharacterised protein [Mycobacteroides abscessus subsp. abscessus]
MKGAESWVFSLFRVVEVEKGWKEKARWQGGFGGPGGCRESAAAGAACRRRGGSAGAGGLTDW